MNANWQWEGQNIYSKITLFFSRNYSHPTAEYTLPRRTPPLQPKSLMMDTYQSLPKTTRHHSGGSSPLVPRNLPSDYKYAHDRLSHFRMSTDERLATKEGMVWQLYEWQQRQQFRHGSPTAPIYTGPDYMDTSAFRVTLEMPRSISVPPSPCDIPPPGHPSKSLSPRRPHTPADRVTVRPLDDFATVDTPSLGSPRGICSQISKVGNVEQFTWSHNFKLVMVSSSLCSDHRSVDHQRR